MTLVVSDAFRAYVTETHDYAREAWACTAAGAPIELLRVEAGSSVHVTTNLVRRQCNLVLIDEDGRYQPRAGGLIDFDDRSFLVRFGVKIAGVWEWCELPLLFPDEDESVIGGGTVSLALSDGMRIVSSESQLADPENYPEGTGLEAFIRAQLVACGAPDDDAYFDLDAGGARFGTDHGYEVGTQRATMLTQALTDHALDLWAAPPLVYMLRPIPDPAILTPVATWARGREVRLLPGTRKRRRALARNHAIVEGVTSDGVPFAVEVFDLDPTSPVMWGKAGVGDLLIHYSSDGITDTDQAYKVAASLLRRRGVIEDFDAVVPTDPSLERRDVVLVDDEGSDTSGRFSLEDFPVPLRPGSQTIRVSRERTLS